MRFVHSRKSDKPLYYGSYLGLDRVLGSVHPVSRSLGKEAHDEHLFISTHQAYEIWFQQIIHELRSVIDIFAFPTVPAKLVIVAADRMERVSKIQALLLQQLSILETMSPMGFLEFRDLLFPASGFQSTQFRVVENMLGLKSDSRIRYGKTGYCSFLADKDAAIVKEAEDSPTLLEVLNMWLERTPFVELGDFDFWAHYREAVNAHARMDHASIDANESVGPANKLKLHEDVDSWLATFDQLFDEEAYAAAVKRGERRLSYAAFKAVIFIELYAEEPILQGPARLLKLVRDVDELLTLWRHNHSLMVHRMLGAKMGTGGSSGFHYLKATTGKHRVFSDLFDIATYLVPDANLPPLPHDIMHRLGYVLELGSDASAAAASAAAAAEAASADA
ncbi:hypothetical protein FNF27_07420 [Cafeteria roenbergensis]|nr:hypothetical protein FNF31_03899 [Cafeteria roenbergensis]KAA0166969.1 hypothetical protein FNF27_07420 [Cafeteria roenbergensis]